MTVLLTRCLDDVDDEVRDRAALNLRMMGESDDMANRFVKNGELETSANCEVLSQCRKYLYAALF